LAMLNELSFEIYSNYFAFLIVILLIDIVFRIAKNEGKYFLNSEKSLEITSSFNRWNSRKGFFKLLLNIFMYTGIFMMIQITGFCVNLVSDGSVFSVSPTINMSLGMGRLPTVPEVSLKEIAQDQDHLIYLPRILEEEEERMISESSISPLGLAKSEKASLLIGNIKSSLNIDVTAMVISKDQRYAFVTVEFYGTLYIVDLKNLESPVILSSLTLKESGYSYRIKTLALSKDKKTLYMSNTRFLEIVDIGDVESPKLISLTNSELFIIYSDEVSKIFKTSLAIDDMTKTLFIGGLGLQVYDVSNPKHPILLKGF